VQKSNDTSTWLAFILIRTKRKTIIYTLREKKEKGSRHEPHEQSSMKENTEDQKEREGDPRQGGCTSCG